jgi:hypothetical protein
MEGRIGVTGRRVRGRIQPLDNRSSREATENGKTKHYEYIELRELFTCKTNYRMNEFVNV